MRLFHSCSEGASARFLNRLDEIVFYKPLTKENISGILELQLNEFRKRLADRQLKLEVTGQGQGATYSQGYDPATFGPDRLKSTDSGKGGNRCCPLYHKE